MLKSWEEPLHIPTQGLAGKGEKKRGGQEEGE